MLLKETTNRLKSNNTPSLEKQAESEVIDISSDDDSDIVEYTASTAATRKPARTESSESVQPDRVLKPILRHATCNHPLPDTDARHRKRQKIVHNNHAYHTNATKQERQECPVIPPLPELANTDWSFNDDFLLEGFGDDVDPFSGTHTTLTTFPPFNESKSELGIAEMNSSNKISSEPSVKKKVICPYYQDSRWETLMFRAYYRLFCLFSKEMYCFLLILSISLMDLS